MVILINAHLFLIKFKYNINKNKHVMELSLTRFACLPIRWIDHHISYLSNPFPFTINTHILSQPIQIIISFLIIGMIYAFHMRTHSHRTHTINRICTRTTINMIHRTYISIQNMRPIIRIRRPTPILPPNKCKTTYILCQFWVRVAIVCVAVSVFFCCCGCWRCCKKNNRKVSTLNAPSESYNVFDWGTLK